MDSGEYQVPSNTQTSNTAPMNEIEQTSLGSLWIPPDLETAINNGVLIPPAILSVRDQSPIPLTDLSLHRLYHSIGMRPSNSRCFNCLQETDYQHRRNWMKCESSCPVCPPEGQHWGAFCPRLCALRRKEGFWRERANLKIRDGFDGPGSGPEGRVRVGAWGEGTDDEESLLLHLCRRFRMHH